MIEPSKFKALDCVEILHADVAEIVDVARSLTPDQKRMQIAGIKTMIDSIETRSATDMRVCLVRILVSLLPDALSIITEILNCIDDASWFEVHFTLFCYLDLVATSEDSQTRFRILQEIEKYLMNARRDTALATRKAADLLGREFPPEIARPLLIRVIREGPRAIGRYCSLVGLGTSIKRYGIHGEEIRLTKEVLRNIIQVDRSQRVRHLAKQLVSIGLSGSNGPLAELDS